VGTLFPDDEGYPAHRSIPSSFPPGKKILTALLVGVGPYAICPVHEAHAEVPHQDHAPVPLPVSYVNVNSIAPAAAPQFFKHNTWNVPGRFPGFTSRR
jgi:hypothetical protein